MKARIHYVIIMWFSMITTVLFDWDGTLLDTLSAWLEAYKETFKILGINSTEEEIVRHVFGNVRGHEYYGITDFERFSSVLKSAVRVKLDLVELHEGVREILEELSSGGYKIGLVTSSPRAFIEQDLEKFQLQEYFDIVVAQEDTVLHKPDPQPLLKAMEYLGSTPEETLMIGDSDKDIFAARAAGVTALFYYPSINQLFYLKDQIESWQAENLISHLSEIKNFLIKV